METKTIAFFDFDGTLTTRDTLFDFTLYMAGPFKFILGLVILFPNLLLTMFKVIDKDKMARHFFKHYYRNKNIHQLEQLVAVYTDKRLPRLMNPDVLKQFLHHKQNNHDVVVVSASPFIWLTKWCKDHGADLIATQIDIKNNIIQGQLSGHRCNGYDKVRRIREKYSLSSYEKIYAYGNSQGDIPMLTLADSRFYINGSVLKKV